MRRLSFLLLITFLLDACNSGTQQKPVRSLQYFDLKGYIAKESKRLAALNPTVDKFVEVNKSGEHKKLKITDWQKELAIFSDADINKSAWQGLFKAHETAELKTYTSDNEKVPVKSLSIRYNKGKIYKLQLLISTANSLYTSNDTLSYYPDSLYEIKKTQHIKLLNEKNYHVSGSFNK
jgi:hypothetical protein